MHSNECSDTIMMLAVILQHWRIQDTHKTNIRIDLKAENRLFVRLFGKKSETMRGFGHQLHR